MEEKGTIFKPGRLVNAATLGKNKLTKEQRKALYDSMPPGNKFMEAFTKHQGYFIIKDPAYFDML